MNKEEIMTLKEKIKTEEKIILAAEEIFLKKGFDGARMQEIANKASINKALLHYYYRSKDKLFLAVFRSLAPKIFPPVFRVLTTDLSFFEKIEQVIINYINLLKVNPRLPLFIMSELSKKSESIIEIMQETFENMDFNPLQLFKEELQNEIDKGNVINIDYQQLFVNIISLCIFPFVGKPILKIIGFENSEKEYDEFIENRKREVPKFIINSIKISK